MYRPFILIFHHLIFTSHVLSFMYRLFILTCHHLIFISHLFNFMYCSFILTFHHLNFTSHVLNSMYRPVILTCHYLIFTSHRHFFMYCPLIDKYCHFIFTFHLLIFMNSYHPSFINLYHFIFTPDLPIFLCHLQFYLYTVMFHFLIDSTCFLISMFCNTKVFVFHQRLCYVSPMFKEFFFMASLTLGFIRHLKLVNINLHLL